MPRTDDFDYPLEEGLIAQHPPAERDKSRLMSLRRAGGQIEHHIFSELPGLLRGGDLLVLNDTRVIPARFFCRRATGGRVEGLFLRERSPGTWEALLKNAGKCRPGEQLELQGAAGTTLRLMENLGQGRWSVEATPPRPAVEALSQAGTVPLPPYIRRPAEASDEADRGRYQTVYAERPGAVAAPTAGLHFTPELFRRLADAGVSTAPVTLHVGMGTFLPVKAERVADHKMHSEWYELPPPAADAINAARREGRRVVAVGTTSVRVLETVAARQGLEQGRSDFRPESGWTDIFIYPPYRFRAVDVLITNFHLPRSTLLMLAAAFCSPGAEDGVGLILNAYAEARRLRYRFFSYGDAMLIE